MSGVLNVLLVEDSADDAALVEHQLRSEPLQIVAKRVENKRDLEKEIGTANWDIILADFSLPQFDALDVLEILRREKSEIPVILVTGTLSEELAVEFMKQGGQDFILKSSLKRLPAALLNAVERAKAEREKRQAEKALAESEERLRLLVDGARDYALCMLGPSGQVLTWNSGGQKLFGYSASEIVGSDFSVLHERADLLETHFGG